MLFILYNIVLPFATTFVCIFGIFKLIDWLFDKYPNRMVKIFSKLNPRYEKAITELNKIHYNNGAKDGFDTAYFQLQEIFVDAFARHEPKGQAAYDCFKTVMNNSEDLLVKFYPNVKDELTSSGISSREVFKTVEDGLNPKKPTGGSGLLN